MRSFFVFCFSISVVFFLGSCTALYQPNLLNVPLHTARGDVQLSGSYGRYGTNFQGSIALTPHIFINGQGSFQIPKKKDNGDFNKHNLGEFALGYYRAEGRGEGFVFEVSAGYGLAKVEYQNTYSTSPSSPIQVRFHAGSNYHKFFLQPSLGLVSDDLELAFSTRMSVLQYFNFVNYYNPNESAKVFPGQVGYVEPVITIRRGVKNLKLFGQLGLSFALNAGRHPLATQGVLVTINVGVYSKFNILPESARYPIAL